MMRNPAHRAQSLGFTLIELMVVVALAAIVLTLAAPSFTDTLARKRLEGAFAEFGTDIQYARSEAVQRNRNVRLVTGAAGTCYTIFVWNGGANCNCEAAPVCASGNPTDPTELKTIQLGNAGVTVTGSTTIDFDPVRGAPAAGTAASAVMTRGSWQLRSNVSVVGRVSSCAPSGSVKGYPSC